MHNMMSKRTLYFYFGMVTKYTVEFIGKALLKCGLRWCPFA
jgi:hypothetical protein